GDVYKRQLENHIKTKHSEHYGKYICPYCNKFLKVELRRNQHIKDMHPESFDKDIHNLYFTCEKCGKNYTNRKKLEEHMKKHLEKDGKKSIHY
ncbi:MAG: C2H2-type zinc finger protein, partial [Methanosarcina sp.]|nr:C2H2-type zinc finger protein [Methanosarcina sp.]